MEEFVQKFENLLETSEESRAASVNLLLEVTKERYQKEYEGCAQACKNMNMAMKISPPKYRKAKKVKLKTVLVIPAFILYVS